MRIRIVDTGIDSDHRMYTDPIREAASYDFHNYDNDTEDDHKYGTDAH